MQSGRELDVQKAYQHEQEQPHTQFPHSRQLHALVSVSQNPGGTNRTHAHDSTNTLKSCGMFQEHRKTLHCKPYSNHVYVED